MRKFWDEFIHISEHVKIREKLMLTRIALAIGTIVMCLAAISFSAYAFFSYNVSSCSNIIKAANFETKVSVQITDKDGKVIETVTPITSNYKMFKVAGLKVGEYYTVTITPTERSTAKTGFIIVSVAGSDQTYHTQQLGVDEGVVGGKTPSISFKLMITDKTDVMFEAHWGTSSYYPDYKDMGEDNELYITQNEEIKIIVNGVVNPYADKTDENTDSTTSSTVNSTTSSTETTTMGTTTSETSAETQQSETMDTTSTLVTEK